MIQITVTPQHAYISGVPVDYQEEFRDLCSYRPQGYQHTKPFKKKKWDGWVRLVKNGRVPAGLVWRITQWADRLELPYQVAKEYDEHEVSRDLDVHLRALLRDYQIEALETTEAYSRGIIRAPTGAGKTVIAAAMIDQKQTPTLIIVPTIDLLHQTRDQLARAFGVRIGQLGDGVAVPNAITVATVRTAAKVMNVVYNGYEFAEYDDRDDTVVNRASLRDWIQHLGMLIVDEAHILAADTVNEVATKLHTPYKYAMSASPWRDDNADLLIEAAIGPIIYRIGTERLVEEGYLVAPTIEVNETVGWWEPASWQSTQFARCYGQEIVDNPVRNGRIAERVQELGEPTLILVKQVKHGRHFEKLIPDAVFLSGRDSGEYRAEVYEQLKSGKLSTIIATVIADMGLDLPILSTLALAGGGKSSVRHLQRIGRVARPYEGKKGALVIDWDDGHVNKWFRDHARKRRQIEKAEWGNSAIWI